MIDDARGDVSTFEARANAVDKRWRMAWYASLAVATLALGWLACDAVGISAYNGERVRRASMARLDLSDECNRDDAAGTRALTATTPLRLAIAPMTSPERSLELYQGLADYLGAALDRPANIVLRNTYAEINGLVRCGQCQLAFVCTAAYVDGQRSFDMQALVIPMVRGATSYRSYIVVPDSSDAASLLELRGMRFASADRLSTSGWLYPASTLKREGIDPATFFSRHVITGSHDRSVEAVASGHVDGTAVESIVYDRMVADEPELAERIRIIAESAPFGMPPMVVPSNLSPGLRDELRDVLTQMHLGEHGQKVLAHMGVDRFVLPDPRSYDGVRELMDEVWEPTS